MLQEGTKWESVEKLCNDEISFSSLGDSMRSNSFKIEFKKHEYEK